MDEKVVSSNFNVKLKLLKKSKRLNKKMKNSNHIRKIDKTKSNSKCLKEISFNKTNREKEITIVNKISSNNTFLIHKENRDNIFITHNNKIYDEILDEMDKMKVNPGSFSIMSNSTCASSCLIRNNSVTNEVIYNTDSNNATNRNLNRDQYNYYFNSLSSNESQKKIESKKKLGQYTHRDYFLCVEPVKKFLIKRTSFVSPHVRNELMPYKNHNLDKRFNNKNKIHPNLIDDIYHRMLNDEKEEENLFILEGYTDMQTDINEKMRAVLIDWLVEVHKLFELIPETLFLSVEIIDKYLCKKFILKHKLQLLGITALWIACKYLDVCVIDLKYCVYVTDNTYTSNEIKQMEKEILYALNYTITSSSLLKFFDILSVNFCLKERTYYMGRYLLEIFLLDSGINKYSKSLVACSAIYLAIKIIQEDLTIYGLILSYTEKEERTLKACAKQILYLVMNINQLGFKGIVNKYSKEEYLEVSKVEIEN